MLFRLLALQLSALVGAYDWLLRRAASLVGRSVSGTCVFLNYHSIGESNQEQFAEQMKMLAQLARPLAQVEPQRLEDCVRYAVVTFDDAFRSFAQQALPALKQLGIPVVLFVPTGYLGRKSAWFDYGGENPVGEEVMSAEELLEVANSKLVSIGSHTVNHLNLAQASPETLRRELADSKGKLEALLGRKMELFSFPYGSFGGRELRAAHEAGYGFLFSVMPNLIRREIKPGVLGRVSVQPSDWPLEFKLKVLGAYRWRVWASGIKQFLRQGFGAGLGCFQ